MYRVIKASTNTEMDDVNVLHLIGRRNYDQLYKQCCFLVDDEICNQYGDDTDVNYENGLCTGRDNGDGTGQIKSAIRADFVTDRGNHKYCYAELESVFDGSVVKGTKVTYFNDEVEYE